MTHAEAIPVTNHADLLREKRSSASAHVAVIGLGYVGLSLAAVETAKLLTL